MPDVIAKLHDKFVRRLIKNGHSSMLRKYRNTFSKHKNGYIFPINIFLNYYFGNENEFCFSSLIVKI